MLRRSSRLLLTTLIALYFAWAVNAHTGRYRCMWRTDPSTTMVIGWDQVSGYNPVLYYDVVDFGAQVSAYRNNQQPDRIIVAKGMNNHFVRLSGLQPNTVYYFVIKDSEGVSRRFSFKTAPDTPTERLSIIAGGDSRNNREARCDANKLVSKLRPHCVIFDGDMTAGDTYQEWREWFDDWQETIGSDGRIFPVIAARGNHEAANSSITELFDVSNADVYYALTLGGNLFRIYTLNSLIPPGGSQRIWLEGDLKASSHITWKMAQYHHAIRPHTQRKPEKDELLLNWATLFHKYSVDLALESDAHVVKTTYPIRPSRDPGSEEGFIRDDEEGTVYIGEGCWGAPLRDNNDDKSWTRASGSFNQFKWIFVDQEKIEVRTVRTDGAVSVAEVSHNNVFDPPIGLVVWNPPTGDVLTIWNRSAVASSSGADRPEPEVSVQGGRPPAPPSNPASRPAPAGSPPPASSVPREPEPAASDPNDWSPFPKVAPDEKGNITIKYFLPQACDVTVQLISPQWKEMARIEFPRQPGGENVKSLDLSRAPAGRYLLVVKGNGKLARRFHVIIR
ncbi:MAG: fibronectin type III domain-containing protein [Phaeodactylibacter sp.]|nr:fibronectin type III domain-containing protein [Phaeodactylibacter sp.]